MHGQTTRGFLSQITASRRQALELLAAAVVLGLGVNLVASWVSESAPRTVTLAVGLLLALMAAAYLASRALWPRVRRLRLEGFCVYDTETQQLASLPGAYELGSSTARYLRSAFAENAALKRLWTEQPLFGADRRAVEQQASSDAPGGRELLRQAVEYFVLESLSVHLTDYFDAPRFRTDGRRRPMLKTLARADLPDVLLENRFLRLFSEPMAERAAFVDSAGDPVDGEVVYAFGPGGVLFSQFKLVLPRGAEVSRDGARIRVATTRFELILEAVVPGYSVNLPRHYGVLAEYDEEAFDRYSPMALVVDVQVRPRRLGMLLPLGWQYYRWLDEWLDRLEEQVSTVGYFERIGFATASTTYQLLSNTPSQRGG